MKAIFEPLLLAIGALVLSSAMSLAAEGMMGIVGQDKPIGNEMSVTGEIGMTGACKDPAN